jgi:hypothetical protein
VVPQDAPALFLATVVVGLAWGVAAVAWVVQAVSFEAEGRPDLPTAENTRYLLILGGIVVGLITLCYCGWVIQSQERRWQEFDTYVRVRDMRRDAQFERLEGMLKRLEARK